MTRPTITALREQRDGPPAPRNTTEPCRTCADTEGALMTDGGIVRVFCAISRDRAALYPMLRSITVLEDAVMPCWRAKVGQ